MAVGKTYTIALDDKAAFLNRLKKQNIQLDANGIQDNTLNHTFTVTIHNPDQVNVVDQLLAQSKDINDNPSTKLAPLKTTNNPKLQELRKLIKKELKEVLQKRSK